MSRHLTAGVIAARARRTDPIALDWFARITLAGSSISDANKAAANTAIAAMRSGGLLPYIKALNFLSGPADLVGALVPVIGTAPTNVGFISGDYSRTLGIQGNGAKYLNSNRLNNADPQDNNHAAVFITGGGTGAIMGTGVANGRYIYDGFPSTGQMWISDNCGETASPTDTESDTTGFAAVSRASGANFQFRRNGTTSTSAVASVSNSADNQAIFATGTNQPYTGRLSSYSLGEAIDLAALDTILTDYMAALV